MIDSVRTQRFHQVATVRKRERLTIRNAAKHFKLPAKTVARLEDETVDLPISVLRRWAEIMKIPVTELLLPVETETGRCVWDRAGMVKIMKSLETIRNSCADESIDRQLSYVRRQLLAMMPELEDVAPFPNHNFNRRKDDYGAVVRNLISDPFVDEEV